jgi:hypothetical protein
MRDFIFLRKPVDHSYDGVYHVLRETVELFRENGSFERKTSSRKANKRKSSDIMRATLWKHLHSHSFERLVPLGK